MTLMTDDIEWYPLPEVEEEDAPVGGRASCNTLSTTASLSSTTLSQSQSYLTPASSVFSCSQRHPSNPHVTGTVQPYLKKSRRTFTPKDSQTSGLDSTESRDSISRTSSTVPASRSGTSRITAGTVKQSVSRQSSSVVSFKTAISSSAPNLKPFKSTSNFKKSPSSVSFKTALSHESVTTALSASASSLHSVNSPLALDQETAASLNTETYRTDQQSGGESSHTLDAAQDLVTDAKTLDTSTQPSQCRTHSQQLKATDVAAAIPASYLPSRVIATGVQLPLDKQATTITLAELDQLWMDFLASSLSRNQPEGASVSLPGPTALKLTTPTTPREEPLRDTLETRDTAIQTTPSLALSVTNHCNQHTSTFQQLPTPRQSSPHLSHLTLQEALKTFRPDFVHRSEQRQKALKRNRELRSQSHCRTAVESRYHPNVTETAKSQRSPHFILINVTKQRPKMSPVEMYHNSRKYWCKLPEVQQKVREQKRESEAATNRLRMKLYQQEVLGRLRRKRK